VPPAHGCPQTGPPSPEVTGAFCRVPSTPLSQAPWYTLPVHLCRFRVRSIMPVLFPGPPSLPLQSSKERQHTAAVTLGRPWNINQVPIGYGFRPHLRGRLTLRGLALRRNPWTCGGRVSHPPCATHVSILTSDTSSVTRVTPSQAYGTLRYHSIPKDGIRSFGTWLEPRYIFGAGRLV